MSFARICCYWPGCNCTADRGIASTPRTSFSRPCLKRTPRRASYRATTRTEKRVVHPAMQARRSRRGEEEPVLAAHHEQGRDAGRMRGDALEAARVAAPIIVRVSEAVVHLRLRCVGGRGRVQLSAPEHERAV